MIKHIVAWKFKDELNKQERTGIAMKIKNDLEWLKDTIKEIIDIEVHINLLDSSTADIIMQATFVNEMDLQSYQLNQEHHRAQILINGVTKDKVVIDYEI